MQIAKKDLRAPENREHFSHRWEISSEELSSWVLRIGNLSEKNLKLLPSIIRNWDLSSLWNFCLWFVCYDDGCVSDEVNSEYVIISIEIHCKILPIRNLHTFRELAIWNGSFDSATIWSEIEKDVDMNIQTDLLRKFLKKK